MDTPRLHPETIEEVKQRSDIVEIVSDYVVLKKRGQNYLGLCPFHEEKTPSFTVTPSKQMYYCFGCQAGGNGIKFLMELGKQSFAEVVLDLAKRYQIPIKTLEPEQRQELQRQISVKEQLYEIMAVASNFYQHALCQPQGEIALTYLQKERQLRGETIQAFGLGYAPAGWETLYRYLVEQKRYPVALVEQAGLIKARQSGGSGYYDQFRHRLMIPICDSQGRVIAFGSRTLSDEQPKYLNSPDTPLFDKGKTLFALDKARSSIIKQDLAVVVEGYFDAIALHAVSIDNVVASLGTALSENQVKQVLRYTESKRIILNFDADKAGIQATERAIQAIAPLVYAGQVQLKILPLADGKDADEFLKTTPNPQGDYGALMEQAPLWIDWQIQQLLKDKDLKQADQFQQVAQKMIALLQKLEERNQRTHYLGHCAEILAQGDSRARNIQLDSLSRQLRKPLTPNNKRKPIPNNPNKTLLEEAEEIILVIYLHCPEYRQEIQQKLEDNDLFFSAENHRFLWQKIMSIPNNYEPFISELENQLLSYPEYSQKLYHLFQLDEVTTYDIHRISVRLQNALATLERENLRYYLDYCLQEYLSLIKTNREQANHYYKEYLQAKLSMMELDRLRLIESEV